MRWPATHPCTGRLLHLGAIAGLLVILSGCLFIPVEYYDVGARHNVSPATKALFRPGVTTREEVLLTLGEPDIIADDGRRIGYAWTKVMAVVESYSDEVKIKRSYLLQISFDAANRVSQVRLLEGRGESVPTMQELESTP